MVENCSATTIAAHFLAISFEVRTGGNWQTAFDNSVFDVDDTVYINGFLVHLDLDYQGMYVLEVVQRGDPGLVSWLAVEYGSDLKDRAEWFPCVAPQPFFECTVDRFDVIAWALAWYRSDQTDADVDEAETAPHRA